MFLSFVCLLMHGYSNIFLVLSLYGFIV
jgi:hypothetical protein